MSNLENRSVMNDVELDAGIFEVGKKYYIKTPTYAYLGTLEAVTGTVFLFSQTATVYETGEYGNFFAAGGVGGNGADIQPHTGAGKMVVDRAGTVLIEYLT